MATNALDSWISGVSKIVDYIADHKMEFNFGGHTNYACSSDFAKWMLSALQEAKANLEEDSEWSGLIVVENGKVFTKDRHNEMLKNGLSDTEELNILSVNFVKPRVQPGDQKPEEKPSDEVKPSASQETSRAEALKVKVESDSTSNDPHTSYASTTGAFSITAMAAILLRRKKN